MGAVAAESFCYLFLCQSLVTLRRNAQMPEEKTFKERVSEARRSEEGLTPSFEKVAHYIETHILRASLSSTREVALVNDVDPATVVRMSQRLGYQGYPDLRSELADSIVEGTGVIDGEDLIPLLEGQREALEAEKAHSQRMVDKIDAEIEWIDRMVELCM
jgi:DNA-binding MurR/RpiR family transcriptional regulator